jgi:FdhD protein
MPGKTQDPGPSQPAESVSESPSLHWSSAEGWTSVPEKLAIEAPLAIEISFERQGQAVRRVLAVTMRTPGSDEELALGFLLAEGLIGGTGDVAGGESAAENSRGERIATRRVALRGVPREDLQRVSRGLITSAACGLCGRPTLEGLPRGESPRRTGEEPITPAIVLGIPGALRRAQKGFDETGGSHGAGLFDRSGALILAREDVGRHNAVDKVIGAALLRGLPPAGLILGLSGRASFELVQKASVAGVAAVVAVGAPSSLAVDLAHASGITLVGFTRGERFNVYTHADRLKA